MSKAKKRIAVIIIIAICAILALNVGWCAIRQIRFNPYVQGMSKSEASTILVPRYCETDKEGFTLAVKYPDYMSLEGNLSVAMPVIEDDMGSADALIIWINGSNKKEYGFIINEDGNQYQIETDSYGQALNKGDQKVIDRHQENVELLLEKANEQW